MPKLIYTPKALDDLGFSTFGGDKEKALGYFEEQMKKVLIYDEEAI